MSNRRFVTIRPYFRLNGTFVQGHTRGWPRSQMAAQALSTPGCNPIVILLKLAVISIFLSIFLLILCWPLILWLLRLYFVFFVWIIQLMCVLLVGTYRIVKQVGIFTFSVASKMGPIAWLRCVFILVITAVASLIYSLR
jgi:hypothetical protein